MQQIHKDLDGGEGHPFLGAVILVLGAIVSLTSSRQARQRAKHFGTSRPSATLHDLAPLTLAIGLVGIASTVNRRALTTSRIRPHSFRFIGSVAALS